MNDVGRFPGEVMIERAPGLRWEFYTGGRRDLSYHRHVVTGFTNVLDKQYHVNLDDLVATYGIRFIMHGPVPCDFFVQTMARAFEHA